MRDGHDEGANRFAAAVERIDAANAGDPNRTMVDGVAVPHEVHYARRMTEWLGRLEPGASEALRLAVRCQHLEQWAIPLASYPFTRAGYHRLRAELAAFHARRGVNMREADGFPLSGRLSRVGVCPKGATRENGTRKRGGDRGGVAVDIRAAPPDRLRRP